MNVEKRVADTILQKPINVKVGDKTYTANQPSVATLIMASKEIAKLPPQDMDSENIVYESLNIAKDCHVIGDVLAILILGAKQIKLQQKQSNSLLKRFYSLFKDQEITKEQLAEDILTDVQPQDLIIMLNRLLDSMQIAFFFGITTSLNDINLLKATKKKTTQYGQS